MRACSCSSKMCELFGCQQEAADRARLQPFAVPVIPISAPGPAPWRFGAAPTQLVTEADVRRIVREELAKIGGTGGVKA